MTKTITNGKIKVSQRVYNAAKGDLPSKKFLHGRLLSVWFEKRRREISVDQNAVTLDQNAVTLTGNLMGTWETDHFLGETEVVANILLVPAYNGKQEVIIIKAYKSGQIPDVPAWTWVKVTGHVVSYSNSKEGQKCVYVFVEKLEETENEMENLVTVEGVINEPSQEERGVIKFRVKIQSSHKRPYLIRCRVLNETLQETVRKLRRGDRVRITGSLCGLKAGATKILVENIKL